jgi:predicted membrane chloride channel (bestrophin family)
MFFGFLIAPLGYIALHKFVTPLNYMFLMVGFSVISVLLALKLYRNNRY